jgi:hypothetical protein
MILESRECCRKIYIGIDLNRYMITLARLVAKTDEAMTVTKLTSLVIGEPFYQSVLIFLSNFFLLLHIPLSF